MVVCECDPVARPGRPARARRALRLAKEGSADPFRALSRPDSAAIREESGCHPCTDIQYHPAREDENLQA